MAPARSRTILMVSILFIAQLCLVVGVLGQEKQSQRTGEPGLLFYLSGDHGFNADFSAGGTPSPNFLANVKIIPEGPKGPAFECANKQLMSFWAPGNIYAERGTLSFFWRSREPVGKTEFPIFRVGYADHSSWDMVFLRIDYNGHGFDAFVTDVNLARIRVSTKLSPFPRPDTWIHLALTWDETVGIRFYVDGKLAVQRDSVDVLYAGLDQFGPHSRVISPSQVQSAYNFQRGGDIDEVRIYDRALSGDNIKRLAKGETAGKIPTVERTLIQPQWRNEWRLRYGWNRPGDIPPHLDQRFMRVRKVEIENAYDLKRWWWKGTDGIRETTWPGVYNRSRLPGRNDYFQLPDWDCYSLSGKSITFFMPDETWNHLEISGGAWGKMELVNPDASASSSSVKLLFERSKGQEKTFHQLDTPLRGGQLRFTNVERETPIGELSAYDVDAGREPQGTRTLSYFLTTQAGKFGEQTAALRKFIAGRYTTDERSVMVAVAKNTPPARENIAPKNTLPLVHILIPYNSRAGDSPASDSSYQWSSINGGLDGIAIELPPLNLQPTDGICIPLNIQVKDPDWPQRNMLDFSISVKRGEPRTLWLDTRDRILPKEKCLYLTIASASPEFDSKTLEGAQIRLVFKPWKDAYREHVQDRFTQVRDNYANLVEEHPTDPRLNLYNRFAADMNELLRIDPKHYPGQNYWYDLDHRHPKPEFVQPACPEGMPLWAFRQVEDLRYFERFVLWWIDHRQIENGELGGGLSDDDDLTNCWPGAALMGCAPEEISTAVLQMLDAIHREGMFTNGLATIQTDGLHSHEEGIEAQTQAMLVNYGSPRQVERIMETVRALDERATGTNKAGHRHFRSSYFSGTKMAEEDPWDWTLQQQEYLLMQPVLTLAEFNGSPRARKLAIDMADGLLAHARKDPTGKLILDSEINFSTDSTRPSPLGTKAMLASNMGDGATMNTSSAGLQLLWGAYRLTGENIYLQPLRDLGEGALGLICSDGLDALNARGSWGKKIVEETTPTKGPDLFRHIAWQMTGNKSFLEGYYADQIESSALREYINTEGSLWSDRVFAANRELQRSRLGGIAIVRGAINIGHAVSWKFKAPANELSAAILVPQATQSEVKILVYTLDQKPVEAIMTTWDIDPGQWEITQGPDADGDEKADTVLSTQTIPLERSKSIRLTFAPRTTTVITLKLKAPSVPYAQRPDLGIDREDVRQEGQLIHVKVHSLGSVASPVATVALVEGEKVIASPQLPTIPPPLDLLPKYEDVTLSLPAGIDPDKCSIVIDPEGKLNEVTRMNNRVQLKKTVPGATGSLPGDQISSLEKKPRPEHLAFNVADPAAVARWYCENLGMKIVRKSPPPATTHFIADSAGNMTLELYNNSKGPIPDYASIHQQSMHLAFAVENPEEVRNRLVAAGAKLLADITTALSGDQIVTLRDPWGLAIQFVRRASPMLKSTGLRFEHLALNVADPQSEANWYVENLGMRVLRQGPPPNHTSFVADDGKHMMLELFRDTTAPFLDLANLSSISVHFAFVVNDVRAYRTGLMEAGAKLAEDVRETNTKDEVLVLRDPWGFPIQFIKRGELLLK